MTEKITYIADDGEEFETEEECLAYEKVFTEVSGYIGVDTHMVFQDPKETGIENAFQHSDFVFITDKESAHDSFCVINYQYGLEHPKDICTGDIFQYDYNCDKWDDVVGAYIKRTNEICKLIKAIDGMIPRNKSGVLHKTTQKIRSAIADFMSETEAL